MPILNQLGKKSWIDGVMKDIKDKELSVKIGDKFIYDGKFVVLLKMEEKEDDVGKYTLCFLSGSDNEEYVATLRQIIRLPKVKSEER